MIKNKRGDATDPFIIMIILSFLAISFIVGVLVNTYLMDVIETTSLNESAAAPTILQAFDKVNTSGVQQAFGMILAILAIFTILSAFLVRQHPAFLFINIILLLVTLFVSILIANTYGRMMDNAVILAVMESQTIIHFVMTHLLTVMLGFGALNMIILFSKIFGAPQGGGDFG